MDNILRASKYFNDRHRHRWSRHRHRQRDSRQRQKGGRHRHRQRGGRHHQIHYSIVLKKKKKNRHFK